MKKSQLEHVLRAARKICGDNEFIVVGSQSLHGKHPDVADSIMSSFEADVIAKNHEDKTEFLNVIGMDSQFHEEFGYYADPVEAKDAVLPRRWRNRLVHLKLDDPDADFHAYCLEPHDLVVAKLAAGREKDKLFIRELMSRDLIKLDTVRLRLAETDLTDARRQAMETLLSALAGA
jgi:hypothetical protein